MILAPHAPYLVGALTAGAIVSDPTNAVGAYTETRSFTVTINGVPSMACELARKEPVGTERGTIIFTSASDGSAFPGGTPEIEQWITDLVNDGWRCIQCRWPTGWHNTTGSGNHGNIILAGRVASMIRYVYDTYVSGGVNNLILTGGSGGSSQHAYCLAFYNIGSLVSKYVPVGGPVHSSVYDLCVGAAGLVGDAGQRSQIDDTFESGLVAGPCELQVATDKGSTWAWNSIQRGNLSWPRTVYVEGQDDTTPAPQQGALLYNKQPLSRARPSFPHATPHNVLSTAKGRAVVADAFYDRYFIRQQTPGASATATSLATTLPRTIAAGTLLVVLHRASTGVANMSGPSGFTLANDGTDNAQATPGSAGVKVYWKVATGGETGLAVSTTTSVLQAASIYEIDTFDSAGSWGVQHVEITVDSGASVLTLALGPTPATAAKAMCFAAVGTSGGFGTVSSWTNGYVEQAAATANRFMSAAKSINNSLATSTAPTWGSATRAAGVLVAFRKV